MAQTYNSPKDEDAAATEVAPIEVELQMPLFAHECFASRPTADDRVDHVDRELREDQPPPSQPREPLWMMAQVTQATQATQARSIPRPAGSRAPFIKRIQSLRESL